MLFNIFALRAKGFKGKGGKGQGTHMECVELQCVFALVVNWLFKLDLHIGEACSLHGLQTGKRLINAFCHLKAEHGIAASAKCAALLGFLKVLLGGDHADNYLVAGRAGKVGEVHLRGRFHIFANNTDEISGDICCDGVAGAGAGAFYWSEATSPPLSKGDLGGMSKSLRQRHKKRRGIPSSNYFTKSDYCAGAGAGASGATSACGQA